MSALDPQLFFRVKDTQYFDRLTYEPSNVDILDIVQFDNEQPRIERKSLGASQLETWLNTPLVPSSNESSRFVRGALRIILGSSARHRIPEENLPISFPDDIHNIVRANLIPFSRSHFQLIIDKFGLPRATPWLCYTSTGHFQRYCLEIGSTSEDAAPRTGVTMRRTSKGILAIDLALSLSHCPKTRVTYALLLGRSEWQAAYIQQQIQELAQIAHHPAFLPTLVCTYHRTLLQRLHDQANSDLFNVETDSGQTWAPVYDEFGLLPQGNCDDAEITKRALGVIQMATAWEAYIRIMLSDVESLQEFIRHVNTLTPAARKDVVRAEGEILDERLRFLGDKGKFVLWRLQYIMQRAQAQQNAIYNYIALQNSEVNSRLAYDSREIAVATKRDSNAMKSISVITMVFLPGTFVATLFATPAIAETSPKQWVYWLVTVLLTLSVLGVWSIWYRWTGSQIAAESNARQSGPTLLKAKSRVA